MTKPDEVYKKLQKHLDSQAVGFPATRSGAEINILKHIFSPSEAEIATYLSYRPEPLETIFSRVEHLVETPAVLEKILIRIQRKGGLESRLNHEKAYYCNAPLVVGMYEFQLERLTPAFIQDFNAYTSDISFGLGFLSTNLPQMRTIPVARSIHPKHGVSTFDEVTTLLEKADGPFVIVDCICRKKKSLQGETCAVTRRSETCMAIGSVAQMVLANDVGREVDRAEAMAIIEQNQTEGLVLQPSNTRKAEFICSCCGCCCGMLGIHKKLPKPLNFWAANYHAAVDDDTCVGCGSCAERCQVNAVGISEEDDRAHINRDRCLGCGVCISECPVDAISLLKNPVEVIPPRTREELYDTIMENKKKKLGKLMLAGKFVIDAVRTGQTHLLKP